MKALWFFIILGNVEAVFAAPYLGPMFIVGPTHTVEYPHDNCRYQYHPNCATYLDRFNRVFGSERVKQIETYLNTGPGNGQYPLIGFESRYDSVGQFGEVRSELSISGRSCSQVDNLEVSYSDFVGTSSFFANALPAKIKISFHTDHCAINEVMIRPENGEMRNLTADMCRESNIDLSRYGVGFFDACLAAFNIIVNTSQINFAKLDGNQSNSDCVDCLVTNNFSPSRASFAREQNLKRNSPSVRADLNRIKNIIQTSNNGPEIYRAMTSLLDLQPFDEAFELLLSVPSLTTNEVALAEYARVAAFWYNYRMTTLPIDIYPEKSLVYRRRILESFATMISRPNISPTLASHYLLQGSDFVASASKKDHVFNLLIGPLTECSRKVGQARLGSGSADLGFISLSLGKVSSFKNNNLSQEQVSQVIQLYKNILPAASSSFVASNSIRTDLTNLLLDNFIRFPNERAYAEILNGQVMGPNSFDRSAFQYKLQQINAMAQSAEPNAREMARRLLQTIQSW